MRTDRYADKQRGDTPGQASQILDRATLQQFATNSTKELGLGERGAERVDKDHAG